MLLIHATPSCGCFFDHNRRLGEIIGNLGPVERQRAVQALGQPVEG
jgi:hypothetical protein